MKWLHGVDGCRGGWVVAKSRPDLQTLSLSVASDLRSVFEREINSVVAIDIPIGIPENESRACDSAARELLGWPRRTSVFSPPVRPALDAKTFWEALHLNRRAAAVGISKQAYCIMPKIREVDGLMTCDRQRHIREVHPEVTFARLNGAPMVHNKKRPEGRAERIAVLQKAGLDISDAWLIQQRSRLGARVAPDDVLDALACLVTACHIRDGRSHTLGRAEQKDSKGLVMEIVTCAHYENI
jgi:predicted RNase H-like nuclease